MANEGKKIIEETNYQVSDNDLIVIMDLDREVSNSSNFWE